MARIWIGATALTAALVLVLSATTTTAAPAPPPTRTVEKFEYCEIQLIPTRRGGPGGAQPAQMETIRLTTGDEEIEVTSWEDLATKLKAPEGKKDSTATMHKMRVINFLGDQGWELVSCTQTSSPIASIGSMGSWSFKRKVTKEVKETKDK